MFNVIARAGKYAKSGSKIRLSFIPKINLKSPAVRYVSPKNNTASKMLTGTVNKSVVKNSFNEPFASVPWREVPFFTVAASVACVGLGALPPFSRCLSRLSS